MDTNGLILGVKVHAANLQDRDGAKHLLEPLKDAEALSRLECIWADGGYGGQLIGWVQTVCGWRLEIVKRPPELKGFQVLPRRWVVERTFGWLGRYRRLARDYEHTTLSSESMVYIASTRRMLKLLAT